MTLRDNLLDEINQLYFDRQRTLLALAAFADRSDPEAAALEIRSRELAAGLDAWTGGWFSEQLRADTRRPAPHEVLSKPREPGPPQQENHERHEAH